MRVLWLCNRIVDDRDGGMTGGSWLGAMSRALLDSGGVDIGIIGNAPVQRFARADYGRMPQWQVPANAPRGRDGLPSASLVQNILAAARQFRPDLIHVWGTEGYWGLLTARGLLQSPALLEMQGLKLTVAEVYYGGLSPLQRLRCLGVKELVKCRTLSLERRELRRWAAMEREMIRGHRSIDVQSPWMAAQVRAINAEAQLFKADRALRTEFEQADPWQPASLSGVFTTSAYPAPFKGLHVAVQAVATLRQRCPDVHLRIAGPLQQAGIRRSGYVRWVNELVRRSGLQARVTWLGALSASQIVRELQAAGAALIPTFMESYCVAMAEAMQIGTPTVVAFTGGTAHLGRDEESCLFFPPGDSAMCAHQLERVLLNQELALRISGQARAVAVTRHDRTGLIRRQIETYEQVLASACPSKLPVTAETAGALT